MKNAQWEATPIAYNAAATKIYHFSFPKDKECIYMHWHERMEILYVRDGELAYQRGNEKGFLRAGQALLIPPCTVHYAVVTQAVIYDVLMFDVRNFYNNTSICGQILPTLYEGEMDVVTVTEDEEVLAVICRLCQEISPDSLISVATVYLLLGLLIEKGLAQPKNDISDGVVRKATAYIEAHFAEELSTSKLSRQFGYTAAHFCRKFKLSTGLPPGLYIKLYRLEQGRRMLERGEGAVTDVAARCGFSDANYFTRSFKAHFGFLPTHCKKRQVSSIIDT